MIEWIGTGYVTGIAPDCYESMHALISVCTYASCAMERYGSKVVFVAFTCMYVKYARDMRIIEDASDASTTHTRKHFRTRQTEPTKKK